MIKRVTTKYNNKKFDIIQRRYLGIELKDIFGLDKNQRILIFRKDIYNNDTEAEVENYEEIELTGKETFISIPEGV